MKNTSSTKVIFIAVAAGLLTVCSLSSIFAQPAAQQPADNLNAYPQARQARQKKMEQELQRLNDVRRQHGQPEQQELEPSRAADGSGGLWLRRQQQQEKTEVKPKSGVGAAKDLKAKTK